MSNQFNIAAMAEKVVADALLAACAEGHTSLDQYTRAADILRKCQRAELAAAHGTWWVPDIRQHLYLVEAIESAMDILEHERTGYMARTLAALARAPVRLPQKGAG